MPRLHAGRKEIEMDIRIILASASPRRQELLRQVGLAPEVMPSHVDESGVGGTPEQMVMELSRRKAEDVADEIRQRMSAADRSSAPDNAGAAERYGGKTPSDAGAAPDADSAETIPEYTYSVVIGADTVVAAGGRILGKPKNEEEAAAMIRLLAGRTHHVYTGVTMIFISSGEQIAFSEGTEAEVCPMTEEQIAFSEGTEAEVCPMMGEPVTFSEGTEVEVYPMTEKQIERYVATGEPMDKAGAYGIQGYFAAYVKGIRGDYNNVVGLPVARVCQELAARGFF